MLVTTMCIAWESNNTKKAQIELWNWICWHEINRFGAAH